MNDTPVNAEDQAAAQKAADIKTIADSVAAVPATDTTPEEDMAIALRGYAIAAETRFEHIVGGAAKGMANTTAELLRCLAEAEIFLANHISQQKAVAAKEGQ